MDKMLLTKSEVCEALGFSRSTLEKEMRSGALPYIKLGKDRMRGDVRFRPEDVQAYVAALPSGPVNPPTEVL